MLSVEVKDFIKSSKNKNAVLHFYNFRLIRICMHFKVDNSIKFKS